MFTYTKEFANSINIPYLQPSSKADLLIDKDSEHKDLLNNREHWFAQEYKEKIYQYTLEEMELEWKTITYQKQRIECYYQISLGNFQSYDEAKNKLFS